MQPGTEAPGPLTTHRAMGAARNLWVTTRTQPHGTVPRARVAAAGSFGPVGRVCASPTKRNRAATHRFSPDAPATGAGPVRRRIGQKRPLQVRGKGVLPVAVPGAPFDPVLWGDARRTRYCTARCRRPSPGGRPGPAGGSGSAGRNGSSRRCADRDPFWRRKRRCRLRRVGSGFSPSLVRCAL
jgi:hypothetical protein